MMRVSARRIGLAVILMPLAFGGTSHGHSPRPSPLFKDARQLLAIARADGRAEVMLLVAAVPGGAPDVARLAEQLEGDVRYLDEEVDYVRVRLPIDRVSAFVESDRIESVTLDYGEREAFRVTPGVGGEGLPMQEGMTQEATAPQAAPDTVWPPRWSDFPLTNPYRAIRDIDAADFVAKNPTFDGRGVTIALLDGHFDFLLPEFQTAYTLDGERIPKLADYINATDPRDDAGHMPQWVDMAREVVASGHQVTYERRTWTMPHDGTFRLGFFNERRFNKHALYLDQDIDRNGNPRGDDGLFGVLWDEQTNDVWIDTNRDLSFADQKPMTDYSVRGDYDAFGTDDPATPVRESVGYTVQTDPENEFISVNVGVFQHATEIMGHVVGNAEPDGRLTGVAPGARLISVYYGVSNAHGLIEGLIAAFKHPLTDIIVLEQSVAIASMSYLLADGRHPISIVAQRLIDRYGKLMFVPGNNTPGLGIVAEDGLAPGAISAGGYQHRESYLANNGFEPEPDDNMHWGGLSHGPSGIGALKPDLLAPSGQMSVDIGYVYRQREQERRGLYQLPPGYFVDGGTSTAAPMAAGAAALVISAAKQTGLAYDAPRLKAALVGSARHIPRLYAHAQGNGLVQVEAAYNLLRELQDVSPMTITSRAPVRTRLSPLLSEPNSGVGLYEREGWSVGDEGVRNVILTRTSGAREPMAFSLELQGDDSAFSVPASVTLPLNRPVEVPVHIAVSSHGAHSAILSLTHPQVPGVAHRVLMTIVASLRPAAENDYTVDTEIELPRPGDRGLFVDVPRGASALQFSATSEDSGAIRLVTISPGREQLYSACPPDLPRGGTCTLPNPEPGVWEINATMHGMIREYDPGRERPLPPARVRLTATVVGIDVVAEERIKTPVAAGTALDVPLTLTNHYGPVPAALAAAALGSAHRTSRSIAAGEQHTYEVIVPEGTTSLRAQISDIVDDGADLDLYLIDCTAADQEAPEPPPVQDRGNKAPPPPPPPCTPRAKAATVDAGGVVEVEDPAAGRWAVVVDAYAVPAGATEYAYLDVYTHPRFGSIAVTDHEQSRDAGESWTANAHVWVAELPDSGRIPLAVFAARGKDAAMANGMSVRLGGLDVPLSPIQVP